MNICKKCKHMRRGHAIDRRPSELGRRAAAPRSSFEGGDYICGARDIVPAKVDPQTGFQALPSGEDCRDLNPDGDCQDFVAAGLLARFFR